MCQHRFSGTNSIRSDISSLSKEFPVQKSGIFKTVHIYCYFQDRTTTRTFFYIFPGLFIHETKVLPDNMDNVLIFWSYTMWCPLVTETPSVIGVYISFVTHIGATTPISRKWSRCSNLRFLRSWHHLCWIAGDSDGSSFEHFVVQQQLCWRVQGSSIGLMQRDLLRVHFQSGNLMFKVWGPLQSGLNPTFEFLRVHVQSGNIYTASILV